MFRKAFVPVVIIAGGLCVVAVQAQQKPAASRSPSLSERLEELRRGLLGGANSSSTRTKRPAGRSSSPTPAKRNGWSSSRKFRPSPGSRPMSTPPVPSAEQSTQAPELPTARTTQRPAAPPLFNSSSRRNSTRNRDRSPAVFQAPTAPVGNAAATRRRRPQVIAPDAKDPVLSPPLVSGRLEPISAPPAERVSSRRRRPFDRSSPVTTETSDTTDNLTTSSASVFTRYSPQLAVSTSGPRKITIGKEATFSIRVKNSGRVAASDVVVVVKVPQWCDVVGAKATAGVTPPIRDAIAGGTVQWALSRLGTGVQEQLDLRIIPRKSRAFDLGVSWTFAPPAAKAMVEVQEPKLLMAVSGPEEMLFGQTKVFKLTLSNPGTGDAENVTIRLQPVDQGGGQVTNHRLGTLAAGDSRVVEIELTARQAGTLAIKASAAADGGLTGKVDHSVLVRRAELRINVSAAKKKYAGTVASYEIQISNPGNATAELIKLTAQLPQGATYVSSSGGGTYRAETGAVQWNLSALRANAREDFEVKCVLSSPGANRIQVTGRAAGDLSDSIAATTQVEALADLKLLVSDPRGPVAVGEEMTYEVRVINRGTKAAQGIDVVAFFSAGIEPIAVEGTTNYEISAGQVVFKKIEHLGAGREIVFKIKAVAAEAGNHIFRTEVLCTSLGTKLAAEETTRFFSEDSTSGARGGAENKPSPSRFSESQEGRWRISGARR